MGCLIIVAAMIVTYMVGGAPMLLICLIAIAAGMISAALERE